MFLNNINKVLLNYIFNKRKPVPLGRWHYVTNFENNIYDNCMGENFYNKIDKNEYKIIYNLKKNKTQK